MAIDISGLNFFMPVFSFLFVTLIVYLILLKTKILGESKFLLVLISFIMAIVFMSFSSLELYVQTIIPWFIVLFVVVLLVLLVAGLSTKSLDKIMTPAFAWVVVGVLIVIFLIAAVKVFNPVFHPDLIVASGEGTSLLEQIKGYLDGGAVGSILLLVIAGVVAWVVTRK